jgi:hypothetical protein
VSDAENTIPSLYRAYPGIPLQVDVQKGGLGVAEPASVPGDQPDEDAGFHEVADNMVFTLW